MFSHRNFVAQCPIIGPIVKQSPTYPAGKVGRTNGSPSPVIQPLDKIPYIYSSGCSREYAYPLSGPKIDGFTLEKVFKRFCSCFKSYLYFFYILFELGTYVKSCKKALLCHTSCVT